MASSPCLLGCVCLCVCAWACIDPPCRNPRPPKRTLGHLMYVYVHPSHAVLLFRPEDHKHTISSNTKASQSNRQSNNRLSPSTSGSTYMYKHCHVLKTNRYLKKKTCWKICFILMVLKAAVCKAKSSAYFSNFSRLFPANFLIIFVISRQK